jgi:CO dehydrogenase/acetyl-CoA synthase alpha subunit
MNYVLSINNSRFAEFLPLIYPPELEVKETTETASSASFLDLYLEFDDSGQLSTKIYDKRDDFNFKIINFPTHMRIKINRLEEGHNSYPLVCRRPAETVSLQRR